MTKGQVPSYIMFYRGSTVLAYYLYCTSIIILEQYCTSVLPVSGGTSSDSRSARERIESSGTTCMSLNFGAFLLHVSADGPLSSYYKKPRIRYSEQLLTWGWGGLENRHTGTQDGNGDPIPDSPRGILPLGDGDGARLIPTGMNLVGKLSPSGIAGTGMVRCAPTPIPADPPREACRGTRS